MDQTPHPDIPQGEVVPTSNTSDVQENKDLAAFSYLWVMSVFVYLAKKDSPFVRFHALQGMTLFALSVVVWFVPLIGRFLELIVLALAVIGFIGAVQGQWKELPVIGSFAHGKGWKKSREEFRGLMGSVHWKYWKKRGGEPAAQKPSTPPSEF
ncbi:hypothetical protein A2635_02295 [Candidatus Peribacteria bacterium RIFCSPHIGHO2_01_FULL_51_9]|nr:MAG: hypothetical protein A2635_02295 [Candidatus Peribacteria bacterium RIFCSPHIGHO2_01_FULL_51_9]